MKFNPNTHNQQKTLFNGTSMIHTDVWITDWVQSDGARFAAIMVIQSGDARLQTKLSAADAQSMIEMLTQHIEHIKEAELELIAIDTKAAA